VPVRRGPDVPAGARARRLALDPAGRAHVLFRTDAGDGFVVPVDRPGDAVAVANAGDIQFLPDGTLVVARRPGETFATFSDGLRGTPLSARGYDGLGIALSPEGRVVFWSGDRGLRSAARARLRYGRAGRVSTYRLDAGAFGTRWGRLFLDACIPAGTDVRVHAATADEEPGGDTVPVGPPANLPEPPVEGTPGHLPLALAPDEDEPGWRLHRRETGRELPWLRFATGDEFETYETPIAAGAGRYLWLTFDLRGNGRFTPRIRSLRAEHPSHDHLRRLPRVYSREPEPADFLRRYLAILDGTLSELEARATDRHVLVDPRSAPAEILPWLASFLGLAVDERWPEPRVRLLIAETASLFRLRGTRWSLERMLELLTGIRPLLLEHYRLRGIGGAFLGEARPGSAAGSVVGESMRVGGEVGRADTEAPAADAFETHAHRFTVVVPARLSAEQDAVLRHVLDVHRPAHTVFDLCSVGTGMRVGRGLHVGLLAMIGPTGAFRELRAGDSALGRSVVVGRPEVGRRLGTSRLGGETWVG
jgi:phage tail-like protein